MKRDYLVTFVSVGLASASYLIRFRLIALRFGSHGFAEYALTRRSYSLLAPIAVLGADFAIARSVAYARGRGEGDLGSFALSALIVMFGGVVLSGTLLVIFSNFFSSVPNPTPVTAYTAWIKVLPWLLLGGGVHTVTFNYLRGLSRFFRANTLLLLNFGLAPIASIYVGDGVDKALAGMSVFWVVVSLAFLLSLGFTRQNRPRYLRTVLRYGVPRAPGDVLNLGLFALPSILIAHQADITAAGLVAFATASLGVIGSALSPLSMVLLPTAAGMIAAGRVSELRRDVIKISLAAVSIVIAATVVVLVGASEVIGFFLGPGLRSGANVLRLMILAAPAYAIYVSLKSVIDARHVRAINTRNMVVVIVVFALATLGLNPPLGGVLSSLVAFDLALYVLAALTVWEAHRALTSFPDEGAVQLLSRD